MDVFIDNKLLHKIIASGSENGKNIFLEAYEQAYTLKDRQVNVIFSWSSLLEYLGIDSLFQNFPVFDDKNNLFKFITSTLTLDTEQSLLIRLYDQIFVECLTHVKAMQQVDQQFLLNQIQQKRQSALFSNENEIFSQALDKYEKLLIEHPYDAIHDLTLYLAWDRACVTLAVLFEYISPNQNILKGLEVFKECLLESFQHIKAQGRTNPSFFRLLEALYAFQLREENLQIHTESEWLTLCQSSLILKPRECLVDVFYVDAAFVAHQDFKNADKKNELLKGFTMDSAEKVNASLALARYMIEKFKLELYTLHPMEIVCLQQDGDALSINAVVQH